MKHTASVMAMTAMMITSAFGISAGAYDDCTFEATMADGSAGTVTVKDGRLSYDIVFTDPTSPFDFPEAIDPTLANCDPDTFYSYFDANYDDSYCFPIDYGFSCGNMEYPVISIEGDMWSM